MEHRRSPRYGFGLAFAALGLCGCHQTTSIPKFQGVPLSGRGIVDLRSDVVESIRVCEFSPKGDLLVIAASTVSRHHYLVRLEAYDPHTQTLVRSFTGISDEVNDVRFTPDGRQLVVACGAPSYTSVPNNHPSVHMFDVASGEHLKSLTDYDEAMESVDISPDGALLATLDIRGQVVLQNLATNEKVTLNQRIPEPAKSYRLSIRFSRDGKWLYTREEQWPVLHASPSIQVGKAVRVPCDALSPDGTKAYVVGATRTAQDLLDWTLPRKAAITEFSFPQGKRGRSWRLDCFESMSFPPRVVLSPDGYSLAAASDAGALVLNLSTSPHAMLWFAKSNYVDSVAISPDGHTLVVAGRGLYVVDMRGTPGE